MDNMNQTPKDVPSFEESSSYSNEYCPYMCRCPFMNNGEMYRDFDNEFEDENRSPMPNTQHYNRPPYYHHYPYYHRPPYYHHYPHYWYGYPKYGWKKPGPWY